MFSASIRPAKFESEAHSSVYVALHSIDRMASFQDRQVIWIAAKPGCVKLKRLWRVSKTLSKRNALQISSGVFMKVHSRDRLREAEAPASQEMEAEMPAMEAGEARPGGGPVRPGRRIQRQDNEGR